MFFHWGQNVCLVMISNLNLVDTWESSGFGNCCVYWQIWMLLANNIISSITLWKPRKAVMMRLFLYIRLGFTSITALLLRASNFRSRNFDFFVIPVSCNHNCTEPMVGLIALYLNCLNVNLRFVSYKVHY